MTNGLIFDSLLDFLTDGNLRRRTTWVENYPPTNLVKVSEDELVIEMALAGFTRDEISVTQHPDRLEIAGECFKDAGGERTYIHRGISRKKFRNTVGMTKDLKVKDVSFRDGLLKIEIKREIPEEMRPKLLEIG